jgi:hypothetical protein
MSFGEPITITVNGVGLSFAKRETSGTSSKWSTADNLWELIISHQIIGENRVRSMARLNQRKIVTDPVDSTNDWDTSSTWLVQERPEFGFSTTELKNQVTGFTTWDVLSATQDKILNRES